MRALFVNLRRLATSTDREVSRYADLVRLARWFDGSDNENAAALWASAFGLYPCRHLAFVADTDGESPPPTSSWWRGAVADVPVMLRASGERKAAGQTARREDFSAVKAQRLRERAVAEAERTAALEELRHQLGPFADRTLSDSARVQLLELHARALSAAGGPLHGPARATAALPDGGRVSLVVTPAPGMVTSLRSPSGNLVLHDLQLELT